MRTDLYEREPGRAYIYVKFRCRRCKRMGQTFVPEERWDWSFLEPARDELSDVERDRLQDAGPISEAEIINFRLRLKDFAQLSQLTGEVAPPAATPASEVAKPEAGEPKASRLGEPKIGDNKPEARDAKSREGGPEGPREARRESKNLGNRDNSARDAKLNANGEIRPDDFSANS